MFRISKNTPALYPTCVTKNRLPVFRTAALKEVICSGLDEARRSAKFFLFAYVVMPDHLHAITGSALKPSKVLQYVNGITARRVINYLKANLYTKSLEKLRHENRGRRHEFSLWDHLANAKTLTHEDVFMQKVNYLHRNPVRAGLVERPEDYRWSSARCWLRRPLEDEPIRVDLDQIAWRKRN